MLTALMMTLLIVQVQTPTAPPSTWDGVPGSDVVRTDPETGEITYPMGQQPSDALTLGCVFGRSNVRCPKPPEPIDFGHRAAAAPTDGGYSRSAAGRDVATGLDATDGASKDVAVMVERMSGEPAPGETGDIFKTADFATGSLEAPTGMGNEKVVEAEPEPQPRSGCRREEYRNADGSGFGVRFVCGTGDQRLLDSVMDALEPSSE